MTGEQVITLVLIVLIICYVARLVYSGARRIRREGFASARAREVASKATELFRSKGADSYTDYQRAVPGADPVQFSDVRGLWRKGGLTPEAVEGVLH